MKRKIKMRTIFTLLFSFVLIIIQAQSAKDTLQAYAFEGVQAYKNSDFTLAEKYFRQALQYGYSDTVQYNLGETLYMQKRKNEALLHWEEVAKHSVNDSIKADAWHNLGNIYYEKKQYEKAVEAYKNSLRLRPDDDETRYNYALAKQKLKQQKKNSKNNRKNKNNRNKQQQNNQNQDNKQNQKQDQKKNKKQDKNKDPNQQQPDKNQNQNEPNKSSDNNRNKPNQNNSGDKRKEKNQRSKLSPEETKRLLQALKNKESQTLRKVKLKNTRPATRKKPDKDW